MEKSWLPEIFLGQVALYTLLWLSTPYIASLLTLILGAVSLVILLLSLIVDWIEPSRIAPWYYRFLLLSFLAPLLVGLLFLFIDGPPQWLVE